jgi:general secretion pathway protein K
MKVARASALPAASLVAMLLAMVGALLLNEMKSTRLSGTESVRFARAQFAADGLLAEGMVRLDTEQGLPLRGIAIEQEYARLTARATSALLDINYAPPAALAELLVAEGVDSVRAATLADRIADWRDEDDLRRTHGAERQDYLDARLAPPENRPFLVETEIAAVMGIDDALARCFAPLLTTFSGAQTVVQASTHPRETAAAMDAMGIVTILTAEADYSEHAVLRKRLWVRLTGDQRRPIWVHRAEQALAPRTEAPSPPCGRLAA